MSFSELNFMNVTELAPVPIQSIRCHVHLLYVVCLFVCTLLETPFYFHLQILRVKLVYRKNIPQGKVKIRTQISDFAILAQKWSKIAAHFFLLFFRVSLLIDLGHNQQQHPTVHSWGVSRVPCRSPAPPLLLTTPPLPLTFRSLSAHLPLPFRLWTLFVDTFC